MTLHRCLLSVVVVVVVIHVANLDLGESLTDSGLMALASAGCGAELVTLTLTGQSLVLGC